MGYVGLRPISSGHVGKPGVDRRTSLAGVGVPSISLITTNIYYDSLLFAASLGVNLHTG